MNIEPDLCAQAITRVEVSPFLIAGKRANFLRHLGPAVEAFYIAGRQYIIDSFPDERFHVWISWGRVASGKKTGRGQLESTAINDQHFHKSLAEKGGVLRVVDLSFSQADNIARLSGLANPDTPRGLALPAAYNNSTGILSRYTFGLIDNFHLSGSENPKEAILAVLEPSGPTAWIDEETHTLKGWNRGFSTVHLLGKLFSHITRVLVITRGSELMRKMVRNRKLVPPGATPEQVINYVLTAPLDVVYQGKPANIKEWPTKDLVALGEEIATNQASAEGLVVNNAQTDWLKREVLHIEDEEEFWIALLSKLGFNLANCAIVHNKPSKKKFTLLQGEMEKNSPMTPELRLWKDLMNRR